MYVRAASYTTSSAEWPPIWHRQEFIGIEYHEKVGLNPDWASSHRGGGRLSAPRKRRQFNRPSPRLLLDWPRGGAATEKKPDFVITRRTSRCVCVCYNFTRVIEYWWDVPPELVQRGGRPTLLLSVQRYHLGRRTKNCSSKKKSTKFTVVLLLLPVCVCCAGRRDSLSVTSRRQLGRLRRECPSAFRLFVRLKTKIFSWPTPFPARSLLWQVSYIRVRVVCVSLETEQSLREAYLNTTHRCRKTINKSANGWEMRKRRRRRLSI